MDFVIVAFIMTAGMGYIEPLNVYPAEMQCGQAGAVVGVQVDRLVNPTAVLWPDPKISGQHCRVSIEAKVAGLIQGEYHIATTIVTTGCCGLVTVEPFIGHDPHTSPEWMRDTVVTTPPALAPVNLQLRPMQ